ncbi:hypothetical protein [Brevundimonas sp.]|uniref:hypothetical protein n=1 Tax=Brevundimonas sp. TaxID=1871086 RepID=UPI00356350FE
MAKTPSPAPVKTLVLIMQAIAVISILYGIYLMWASDAPSLPFLLGGAIASSLSTVIASQLGKKAKGD